MLRLMICELASRSINGSGDRHHPWVSGDHTDSSNPTPAATWIGASPAHGPAYQRWSNLNVSFSGSQASGLSRLLADTIEVHLRDQQAHAFPLDSLGKLNSGQIGPVLAPAITPGSVVFDAFLGF